MTNPYEPTKASLEAIDVQPSLPIDRIQRISKFQKLLMLAIVINLGSPLIPAVGKYIYLCNIGLQVWVVYCLAEAIEVQRQGFSSAGGFKWVLAMFLPYVSVLVLLVLNRKATKFLRESGVKVGLLGAKL